MGGGGGGFLVVVGGDGGVRIWYAVYTMQLGSSRHPLPCGSGQTCNCDQRYGEVIRN